MKNSKLIALVLEETGLERKELEHILKCKQCELLGDQYGGTYYCPEFVEKFWGQQRHPSSSLGGLVPSDLPRLWEKEILTMAVPELQFGKKEEKDGSEEA